MKARRIGPIFVLLVATLNLHAASGEHLTTSSGIGNIHRLGAEFATIYYLPEGQELRDKLPWLWRNTFTDDATLLGLGTLLDRWTVNPNLKDLNDYDRAQAAIKVLDDIRRPISTLAGYASDPNTPMNVLHDIAFKLQWQILEEGALFSTDDRARILDMISTARQRLGEKESAMLDEEMREFRQMTGTAVEFPYEGIVTSRAPVSLVHALARSPSTRTIPYVGDRIYERPMSSKLREIGPLSVVWVFNHALANHDHPFHANLTYAHDAEKALRYVREELRAQEIPVVNIIWDKAELWWLTAALSKSPVLAHVDLVMGQEHYMHMNLLEGKKHRETARRHAQFGPVEDLSPFNMPIIISDDSSISAVADDAGYSHFWVPPAYHRQDSGEEPLMDAAYEAIDYLLGPGVTSPKNFTLKELRSEADRVDRALDKLRGNVHRIFER